LAQTRSIHERRCTSGQTAFLPKPGLKTEKQSIVVLIGATPEGRKEFFGFADGWWKATGEIWPTTREERCCWLPKAASVLAKLVEEAAAEGPTCPAGYLDGRRRPPLRLASMH
jgi:hypothetical protein